MFKAELKTTESQAPRGESSCIAGVRISKVWFHELAPAEKTIATGKRIIDYRAEVTLKAIRKALEGSTSH